MRARDVGDADGGCGCGGCEAPPHGGRDVLGINVPEVVCGMGRRHCSLRERRRAGDGDGEKDDCQIRGQTFFGSSLLLWLFTAWLRQKKGGEKSTSFLIE